jgi:CHAT domain-containing protein
VSRGAITSVICALAAFSSACAPDPRKTYDTALKQFRRGNSPEARRQIARTRTATPPQTYWQARLSLLEAEIALGDGAIDDAEKKLAVAVPSIPEYQSLEARRRMDLAHAALRRAKYEESVRLLGEAEKLAAANDDELRLEIATLRGWLAMETQPAKEAQDALESAYQKAVELGDLYRQSALLNNLGTILARLGRYDEAIPYFQRALDVTKRAEAYKYEGNILGNLGVCHYRLGDFDRALRYTLEAVDQQRKANARSGLQANLGKLGNIYYLKGDIQAAIRHFREALGIAREMSLTEYACSWAGNLASAYAEARQWDEAEKSNHELRDLLTPSTLRRREAQLRMNEGDIAAGRGQLEAAAGIYRELIRSTNKGPGVAWEANAALANVYSRLKRSDLASRHYEQALRIIETTRGSLLRNEYKVTFLQGLIRFYRLYVDHLVARGEVVRALEVADSSRARLLAENFGLAATPYRTRQAFDYCALSRTMDAALMSYWIGPEHSYLWVITPTQVKLARLPGESAIEKLVHAWNNAILELRDPVHDRTAAGDALYQVLISEAAHLLPVNSRVVLIPDGPLHRLNFETLPVNGRAWIESAAIVIAPALRVLRQDAPSAVDQRRVLILGDPEAHSSDFPKLKHAGGEITKIKTVFSGSGTSAYTGKRATPAGYFDAQPQHYSMIHFASHAVANPQSPLDSAIILGDDARGSYKLYARDILRQQLDARLVTISACRSAGVTSYAGEGLVGLAWAFLQSGARNVIAGLWDVPDASTAELMGNLYDALSRGRDPVDALRETKLAFLRSAGSYRKPYYWAPFQIYVRAKPWQSNSQVTRRSKLARTIVSR